MRSVGGHSPAKEAGRRLDRLIGASGGEKKSVGEHSSAEEAGRRLDRLIEPSGGENKKRSVGGHIPAKEARCFAWLHSGEGSSLFRLATLWRRVLAVPPGHTLAKGARCLAWLHTLAKGARCSAWPHSGEGCSRFRLVALGGRLDRLIEPQRGRKKNTNKNRSAGGHSPAKEARCFAWLHSGEGGEERARG